MKSKIEKYLKGLKERNLYRELSADNNEYQINFATNDYLQLSQTNPLKNFALGGSASSRLFASNEIYHKTEQAIANFKGKEESLVFASGYQANVSVIPAILSLKLHENKPIVFADRLIHSSMQIGLKIAGVRQNRFNNVDMNHLESLLNEHKNSDNPKFIFTESLFGMDGTITNMKDLTYLAKKHNAFVYLDEAHATGVYGKKGSGLSSGFEEGIGIIMGTFSKAFGLQGGYIACAKYIKEYLVNTCSGFIYTTAPMVNLFPAIIERIKTVSAMDKERHRIQEIAEYMRQQLLKYDFNITSNEGHIISIIVGDSKKVMGIKESLKQHSINVSAVRFPTVPLKTDRIRLAIHSGITKVNVDDFISKFTICAN